MLCTSNTSPKKAPSPAINSALCTSGASEAASMSKVARLLLDGNENGPEDC